MYKIYLFGTPRIYKNGELVHISRRKSLAILAFLAVTDQPHSRDELATLFYPDQNQSSARNNLRRDLSELKSSLDADILVLKREHVNLISPKQVWVDINEFLGHVSYVRQHHLSQQTDKHSPIHADCMVRLTQAIELYSADFMSGFTVTSSRQFEDWQFFQAENLRQVLSEIIQQLIQWHSELGEFEQAIAYGRRWLAMDPVHEPAHRQLISLYARSGQQAAALRQYQECVRQLQNELGVGPDEETSALFNTIHIRKPADQPSGDTISPTQLSGRNIPDQIRHNLPTADEPLIGRERELELIIHKLRDDPDCRMLTIAGPGGIGKTRLGIESAFRLSEDDTCPFCEGIFYVSLTALSTAEAIIPAIAETLKLPLLPDPEQRTQQLNGYLHSKRLLLLLDNFEHLVNAHSVQLLVDLLA